jgi:meiotically up-regulated gene 157 (Mug157) protein
MNRKKFTRISAIAATGLMVAPAFLKAAAPVLTSNRPMVGKRNFVSESVEALIAEFKKNVKDEELGWMFENCFPNTLDTTVFYELKDGKPDTYVITGDIDAMWLRDSSAQVNPYLPLCKDDKHLSSMVEGVIRRQTQCILLDPFANAFYKDSNKVSPWKSDKTEMKPGVHERKWELDSLCYCIRLAYQYWKITGNTAQMDDDWYRAMVLAVATMLDQQRKNNKGQYHFQRITLSNSDTLTGEGFGPPVKANGMICSAFRNSDDATTYLYNIPENLFAVTVLRQLAEMLGVVNDKSKLAPVCFSLAEDVEQATLKEGITDSPQFGKIYTYECDGQGHYKLMEDAGIPGLITIPYLGYGKVDDGVYKNSRKFALSPANPYYFTSKNADGIGSQHTAGKGEMIWPMGIISRAITSTDNDEIKHCIKMLKDTQAGTGFMHESFKGNNPKNFTRHWFAWANSFFGEMVWKVYREKRELLQV